jgi:hypothetical protein
MFREPLCPSSGAHDYFTVHHMERLILCLCCLAVWCRLASYVTGLTAIAIAVAVLSVIKH